MVILLSITDALQEGFFMAGCPIFFAYFAKRVGDGDHRCSSMDEDTSEVSEKPPAGDERGIPRFKKRKGGTRATISTSLPREFNAGGPAYAPSPTLQGAWSSSAWAGAFVGH